MTRKEVQVIELSWEGPLTLKEFDGLDKPSDFGVYQVYGTHSVFGTDALLYIGKAAEQFFGSRLSQHLGWFQNEPSDLRIYVGRLGGPPQRIDDKAWSTEIDCAERLLIHSCTPPYNSQGINSYGLHKNIVVLNFGHRNRLPSVVTSLYSESECWRKDEKTWALYAYTKSSE